MKQLMLYTSAITKNFQKYSHTQSLQNIQQTQLQMQKPNVRDGIYVMQQTIHMQI